ncbi:DUF4328 domain-containing protein [Nocardia sp. SYP-A9097]|uniref:DUF4328 domain-containing protein n=1 Tax=Nocardia sp. SYP-A9097 TaxID=2663237 RepID=UPI00129A0B4C|nr:DUF4328 domain-containing protein [Nocardia sp. SYP-A9097]MRH86233.1 DUF4328 domain-containing protein [Nocardia sp. SYP-A9097]
MNGGNVADQRSAVVQPCARCGARWAVQGKPLHWCPRCHGVLLSPAPVDAPPARRNYRWVARPPGRKAHPGQAVRPQVSPETPRYNQIPRWGLRDRVPDEVAAPVGRLEALTARLPSLLVGTAAVFGLAALAELGRYGILLRNRRFLIQPWLLWISDGAVTVSAIVAALLALLTAVALVGWLVQARRTAYSGVRKVDPRPRFELFLGCLIPGVNLVWPGVFLTETVRAGELDPRLLRAVRIWWAAWVLNGLLVVAVVLYRFAGSLQVRADGVLVTMWTDLIAAGVAVLTLWLVRAFAGLDLRGEPLTVRRWLPATAPAVPVIAPVRPVADRESGSAGRAPADAVGNDEATAPNPVTAPADGAPEPEHEEVFAK